MRAARVARLSPAPPRWRRFGELAIALDAEPAVAALCERWLGAVAWSDAPAPAGAIQVSVRTGGLGELVIEAPALGAPIAAPAAEALADLELRAVNAALERSVAPLALHAAVVARGARAALLVGRHAAGKTTLALAGDWRVRGDDLAFVDGAGRVAALPRALRVRMTSLPHLPPRVAAAVRRDGVRDDAEQLYRVSSLLCAGAPVTPRAVVFVRYQPGAAVELRTVASAHALPALLEHSCGPHVDPRAALAAMALLGRAAAWELCYGGAPAHAAAALAGLVRD